MTVFEMLFVLFVLSRNGYGWPGEGGAGEVGEETRRRERNKKGEMIKLG